MVECARWFFALVRDFFSHELLLGDVKIGHHIWKLAVLAANQAGQDEAMVKKVMVVFLPGYSPNELPCIYPSFGTLLGVLPGDTSRVLVYNAQCINYANIFIYV